MSRKSRRNYQIQSTMVHRGRVSGGLPFAQQTLSYVVEAPDWYQDTFSGVFPPLMDIAEGACPPPENTGSGQDCFRTRAYEIPEAFPHAEASKRLAAYEAATATRLGLPHTFVDFINDETPLFISQTIETKSPIEWAIWRRRWAQWGAGELTAPSRFPAFINATVYSADSCTLLSEIQRHMLEPVIDNGVSWTMWTQDEVLKYLNTRLSRFMMETGLINEITTIPATAGTGEYNYPTDLIESRRVAWDDGATVAVLPRIDPYQLDNARPGWQAEQDTPENVIEEPREPLSFRLAPTPDVSGNVDLVYIAAPTEITSACAPIPFPCQYAWAIKYGVMADMLNKEGEAQDQERATFCERRYSEGVELARMLINKGVSSGAA